MKFRAFAVAAVALAALGGCATYDYAGGGAPGGYYSGRPEVEYYGGYGYPYSYGGYGYGYYGYPYGGYAYPYGYGGYYPYRYYPYPSRPRPRPDNGGSQPQPRPPVTRQPDGDRPPWRDLQRLRERREAQRQQMQTMPRSSVPQAAPRVMPAPRQQSGDQGGGRMSRMIQRARQAQQEP